MIPGSYGFAQDEIIVSVVTILVCWSKPPGLKPQNRTSSQSTMSKAKEKRRLKKNIPCLKSLSTSDRVDESFRKSWEGVC